MPGRRHGKGHVKEVGTELLRCGSNCHGRVQREDSNHVSQFGSQRLLRGSALNEKHLSLETNESNVKVSEWAKSESCQDDLCQEQAKRNQMWKGKVEA